MTRGTLLFWEEPPAGLADTAQVYAMAAATPVANMALTDSNDRAFTTEAGSATSTSSALFGDVTTDVVFTADEVGDENVVLGTELTVDAGDLVAGLSGTCTVVDVGEATTVVGQRFSFTGLDAATYYATLSEAVALTDLGYADVEAECETANENALMTVGATPTFTSPAPSDLSANLTVIAATPAKFFPIVDAPLAFGGVITLTGRVRRENDGRYSAIVFTSPVGT